MLLEFKFNWCEPGPEALCDALSDIVETISWSEAPKNSWVIEGVLKSNVKDELMTRLEIYSALHGINLPTIDIEPLVEKDWVTENEKSFPSIQIASYYIYGSHLNEEKPKDKIPLLLDAEAAFGSGRHESTRGCLMAIDKLCKNHVFNSPLDLGCGSGILAIALAKRLNSPITASDIDPDSVRIANENAIKNNVTHVKAYLSDGFESNELKSKAPFDLIVANILALPLCYLAPHIENHTSKDAYVILSGLLNEQQEMVLSAYKIAGFDLIESYNLGEWATLILKKRNL
jgi:ribosomal protein L11 methyltransferase